MSTLYSLHAYSEVLPAKHPSMSAKGIIPCNCVHTRASLSSFRVRKSLQCMSRTHLGFQHGLQLVAFRQTRKSSRHFLEQEFLTCEHEPSFNEILIRSKSCLLSLHACPSWATLPYPLRHCRFILSSIYFKPNFVPTRPAVFEKD